MTARRRHLRIASPPAPEGTPHRAVLADAVEGERLLQRHGVRGLREALSVTGTAEPSGGWPHFWRGYAFQFDDLAQARTEWLAAEARFAEAAMSAGSISPRAA